MSSNYLHKIDDTQPILKGAAVAGGFEGVHVMDRGRNDSIDSRIEDRLQIYDQYVAGLVAGDILISGSTIDNVNVTGTVTLAGLTFPTGTGTSGQILETDGSGNLSWTTNVGGGGGTGISNIVEDTTPQLGGTLDINNHQISGYTASRALITDSNGQIGVSAVTATEISYLANVTSAIQTQLNGKQAAGSYLTSLSGLTTDDLTQGTGNVYFPGFTDLSTDYSFTDNSSNWDTAYGWGDHGSAGYLTSISGEDLSVADNTTSAFITAADVPANETDPVFTGSAAYGISAGDISSWDTAYGWGDHAGLYDTVGTALSEVGGHESTYNHGNYNTAYGWGNHADAGYLTDISGEDLSTADNTTSQFITQGDIDWASNVPSNEADPVFTGSPAYSITTGDIDNWDTAFGWGDHSGAGYLTSISGEDLSTADNSTSAFISNISGQDLSTADNTTSAFITAADVPTNETDPVFTGSAAYGISAGNISAWDTAYGWGDHAGLYDTAGTAENLISNTKLDDLASPDDNTDLNASTMTHGLLPKLDGNATHVLLGDGTWGVSPGGGFDNPGTGNVVDSGIVLWSGDGADTVSGTTLVTFTTGISGVANTGQFFSFRATTGGPEGFMGIDGGNTTMLGSDVGFFKLKTLQSDDYLQFYVSSTGNNITGTATLDINCDTSFNGDIVFNNPVYLYDKVNLANTGPPESVTNGDIWYDTTTHQFCAHTNEGTVGLGLKKSIEDDGAASITIPGSGSGKVYATTDGSSRTYILPPASPGRVYEFQICGTGTIDIDPSGTQVIHHTGGPGSAGGVCAGSGDGSAIKLICIGTNWYSQSHEGDWVLS